MGDNNWTDANKTEPQGDWGQAAVNNESGFGAGSGSISFDNYKPSGSSSTMKLKLLPAIVGSDAE